METEAWWAGRERILNARPIPPVRAQQRLEPSRPVRARIEWSRSGVETIESVATSWVPGLVLVTIPDGRSMVRGVWLTIEDAVPASPNADMGAMSPNGDVLIAPPIEADR